MKTIKILLAFILLLMVGACVYVTDWAMYSSSARISLLEEAGVEIKDGCFYVNASLNERELKALHIQRNKYGGTIIWRY
jgi:hypothetical protein